MKKTYSSLFFCFMALFLLFSFTLPVVGEESLFVKGKEGFTLEKEAVILDSLQKDNTLYLLTTDELYSYIMEEEQVPYKTMEISVELNIGSLFLFEENIYGLNLETGEGFLLNLEEKKTDTSATIHLDWEEVTELQSQGQRIKVLGVIENQLFISLREDQNGDVIDYLSGFLLPTGEEKYYYTDGIQQVFPYVQGSLMVYVEKHSNEGYQNGIGQLNWKNDQLDFWEKEVPNLSKALCYQKDTFYFMEDTMVVSYNHQTKEKTNIGFLPFQGEKGYLNREGTHYYGVGIEGIAFINTTSQKNQEKK